LAEINIRPMVFCFGDMEIMHNFKDQGAIPNGIFHLELLKCQDMVTVFEIIDSHKPGFVYLQQSYVVRKL